MSEIDKQNDRQAFKMIPWMQSLLSEHRKGKKFCDCGHRLIVQSDTITGRGEYVVYEKCTSCDEVHTTRHPPEWTARTTAKLRQERG